MSDRHDRRAGGARPGLLTALCVLAWAAPPAAAADFDLLTPVPGLTSAVAYGVSADGSVVVGVSYTVSTSNSHRGTRWVRVGGSYTPSSIGVPPGGADSWAFATSADGGVAVGQGTVGSTQAIRWTQATGTTAPLTGFGLNVANDVSADGTVWAGYASIITSGTDYRAVRVTGTGGSQTVQTFNPIAGSFGGQPYAMSLGNGLSGDGRVTVGYSTTAQLGGERPTVWNDQGVVTAIGAADFFGQATAASANGSVVVGWGPYPVGAGTQRFAFRWTAADGPVSLGSLVFNGRTWAWDVSADGSVVVGEALVLSGQRAAFVWDAQTGQMRDLNAVLVAQGVDLGGWTLTTAEAVTGTEAGGYNIAGTASFGGGSTRGYVVTGVHLTPVPEPAHGLLAGLVGAACWRVGRWVRGRFFRVGLVEILTPDILKVYPT